MALLLVLGLSPLAAGLGLAPVDTLAAARRLPGQAGQALAGVARHAFTQGLHVAFAVSAATVLGAAVLAALRLRHLRPAAEPQAAD